MGSESKKFRKGVESRTTLKILVLYPPIISSFPTLYQFQIFSAPLHLMGFFTKSTQKGILGQHACIKSMIKECLISKRTERG